MVNRIRASDPCALNKGRGLKFIIGSWAWQETPEEPQRTYRLKHCEYNSKDEDNSAKTLNDKKLFYYLTIQSNVRLASTQQRVMVIWQCDEDGNRKLDFHCGRSVCVYIYIYIYLHKKKTTKFQTKNINSAIEV